MNPAWVATITALATAVVTIGAWAMRRMWRVYRKTEAFLDDWGGHAATPGHAAKPGVMERLATLETNTATLNAKMADQDTVLGVIKGEVTFNSGHSIKDTVREIMARLDTFQPPDGRRR